MLRKIALVSFGLAPILVVLVLLGAASWRQPDNADSITVDEGHLDA